MGKKKISIIFFLIAAMLILIGTVSYAPISLAAAEENVSEITSDTAELSSSTSSITLSASAATATSITLSWNSISGAKNYIVYRSTSKSSGYKKIATVSSTKNEYKNSGLSEKSTYYYKVTAVTSSGNVTSNIKTKIKVQGNYTVGAYGGLTSSQLQFVKDGVANVVNTILEDSYSETTKLFCIFYYVECNATYQTMGNSYNYCYTPYGFFKYKKVQCTGASQTVKLLCEAIGLTSNTKLSGSHMYAIVETSKSTYTYPAISFRDSPETFIFDSSIIIYGRITYDDVLFVWNEKKHTYLPVNSSGWYNNENLNISPGHNYNQFYVNENGKVTYLLTNKALYSCSNFLSENSVFETEEIVTGNPNTIRKIQGKLFYVNNDGEITVYTSRWVMDENEKYFCYVDDAGYIEYIIESNNLYKYDFDSGKKTKVTLKANSYIKKYNMVFRTDSKGKLVIKEGWVKNSKGKYICYVNTYGNVEYKIKSKKVYRWYAYENQWIEDTLSKSSYNEIGNLCFYAGTSGKIVSTKGWHKDSDGIYTYYVGKNGNVVYKIDGNRMYKWKSGKWKELTFNKYSYIKNHGVVFYNSETYYFRMAEEWYTDSEGNYCCYVNKSGAVKLKIKNGKLFKWVNNGWEKINLPSSSSVEKKGMTFETDENGIIINAEIR